MRILRIIASMDPVHGGPCQGIRNSIPAQEICGVENEVLCFDSPNAPFLGQDDFQVHAIGPGVGPYAYCKKLKSWLKENLHRFEVVIVHGIWLYNSYGTYRIWKNLKQHNLGFPRLYIMPHGMLDPYFQMAPERRLKAVRNWFFWKLVESKVVNGADGILFTCEQELVLARKAFKPYHPKVEINVGYGIQLPPKSTSTGSGKFYEKCPEVKFKPFWLFLSRLHAKKGVDILIKAYLRLKQQKRAIPDLVIAGPGLETLYGKNIQKLAKGSSIYFSGMLEGPAKWEAFFSCEAFILPSHQENFGIAVVEALACGKPVLISNQVNIWREIQNGDAGLICEDTEEGILTMLRYWSKETPEIRKEMGKNASEVFQKHFLVEKAARRMIECIQ